MSSLPVDAFASLVPGGAELRDGYADVGDITLHYVEAGEGPLVAPSQGRQQGMINYYRRLGERVPKKAETDIHPISARTLVIGERVTAISGQS